jgi:hypothetical protein
MLCAVCGAVWDDVGRVLDETDLEARNPPE